MNQYGGIASNDSSFDSYWAVLQWLKIPVGIHIGPTPMGASYMPGWEKVIGRFHSPLLMGEVLFETDFQKLPDSNN
jgi:hypothetical protein